MSKSQTITETTRSASGGSRILREILRSVRRMTGKKNRLDVSGRHRLPETSTFAEKEDDRITYPCQLFGFSRITHPGEYRGHKAFTLIELLITITILAILGSAISIVLNPAELLAEARDSQRINDLESLRNSLSLTLIDNPSLFDSLSNTSIYLSLPSSSCLTNPPSGYTYICNATSLNLQKTDSTGWLPLSLTNLPVFPIDPVNSSSSSLYYAFVPDSTNKTFVLTSLLESEKYLKLSALKDGGTDPGRIEEGNPALWTSASGLVGYWPMDEGSGSVAGDLSGNNNTGTLTNGPTWSASSSCKVGQCLSFDGLNDYISIAHNSLNQYTGGGLTILGWVNIGSGDTAGAIFSKPWNGNGQYNYRVDLNLSGQVYGNPSGSSTGGGYISLDSFHQVVLVLNDAAKTISIYTDGSVRGSTSHSISNYSPSLGNSNLPLTLMTVYPYGSGWAGLASHAISGYLDDIRLYNRALSAAEIQAIYSAQK